MENAAEIIRSAYDAYNRGDYEAAAEHIDPEIVWNRAAKVERAVHGIDAAKALMEPQAFSSQHNEIHAIEVLGEFVLVDTTFHAVGAASGIELNQSGYHLWKVRDGKAIEFSPFDEREDALRAAQGAA